MNDRYPLVSIGLPVYNGEKFVGDAIRCVLAQTFSDWELLISDNASTDRTVSICEKFAKSDSRIRLFQNRRNMGFAPNYNNVFHLSRGKYFKWITHDDLFCADFIAECLAELERDGKTILAFPRLAYVDPDARMLRGQQSSLSILGETPEERVNELVRLETEGTDIYWSQFGLIRREVLARTGLIGLYNGSDQVLLFELALLGKLKQLDTATFFRREHPDSSTMRTGWTAKDRAIFAYADDRRKLVFPYCRMLREHLACIRNSSRPLRGKIRCAAAVARRFGVQWKYFAHEVVESPWEALRAK